MSAMKRVLKSATFIRIGAWFASLLIYGIYLTCRKHANVPDSAALYFSGEQQAIFCFWHGRLLIMPCIKPRSMQMHVLVSHHADGEWIARISENFGVGTIRGSSSKGAIGGAKNLLKAARAGMSIGITPDGPRGPNRTVADGVIWAAQATGLPIIAVSYSASRVKQLNSWDRFMIPLPFSRLHYAITEPVHVARDSDAGALEEARKTLQNTLNSLTDSCDQEAGIPLIQPNQA